MDITWAGFGSFVAQVRGILAHLATGMCPRNVWEAFSGGQVVESGHHLDRIWCICGPGGDSWISPGPELGPLWPRWGEGDGFPERREGRSFRCWEGGGVYGRGDAAGGTGGKSVFGCAWFLYTFHPSAPVRDLRYRSVHIGHIFRLGSLGRFGGRTEWLTCPGR